MTNIALSPPTALPFRVFLVPGSHFDLGWCLHPEGALAVGDYIIQEAVDLITDSQRQFRFTVEYTAFFRHFLDTFPHYRQRCEDLLRDGRLEVCATSTGAMEQILDGEALVRQLTHGIGWLRGDLGYTPVCAQHTDLPGHTIQMPQILRKCGIAYIAYSRYRPPCPLHWWEAPDGSRVLACNHVYHYDWGRVFRKDEEDAREELLRKLTGRFPSFWPAQQVLMPEEHDLEWIAPQMVERIQKWNEKYSDTATIETATLRQFFESVDTARLPSYGGESPYGFYSIPAFEPQTYQQCRLAENAIVAAERFSVFRWLDQLGRLQQKELDQGWADLFWPHDHNIAGKDGEINDSVRQHRATNARVLAEGVLRKIEASYLVHVKADDTLGTAVLVFNPLSWRRSGVVETTMELPGPTVGGVQIKAPDGRTVPCQLLGVERADEERIDYELDDPEKVQFRARVSFVADDVPATGYKAFYISKSPEAERPRRTGKLRENGDGVFETPHWRVELSAGRITSLICKRSGRELVPEDELGFFSLVALEDLRGNLEDGYDPWDQRDNPPNFTGRYWLAEAFADQAQIVEHGPVRTILRTPGRLLDSPVLHEIVLYEHMPHLHLNVVIDWAGCKNRQVRLRLPFALREPTVTYETPFGSVVFGRDEMPNTYRGDGTRWVQKWVDLSEQGFGIVLAAGCCAVNFSGATVSPLLISTTYCRGNAYYWTYNRGRHRFSFGLRTHSGNWQADRAYGIGWEQWSPLRVARVQPRLLGVPHRAFLPDAREYLRCDDPRVVVTSLKQADDGAGYVLRVFNVSDQPAATEVTFAFPLRGAASCSMTEEALQTTTHRGNALPVELQPFEIASFRLQFECNDRVTPRAGARVADLI